MATTEYNLFSKKMVVEPTGSSLTPQEAAKIRELQPGAVMFRKRNFLSGDGVGYDQWFPVFAALVQDIRNEIKREKIIFCIDHEGGRVIRPPLPITRFPYQHYWGDELKTVVKAIATEMKSLGINLLFGPVVDIHSNPANTVIADRAFGTTAEEVSAKAILFLKTLEAEGLEGCIKHFPGHGDTSVDSHYDLPILNFSLEQLRSRELVPFKAAIEAGASSVMTAHLILNQIDPANQATISKIIMHDILRKELGFKGVIFADALAMNAIFKEIHKPEFMQKTVEATVDFFEVVGDACTLDHALLLVKNGIDLLKSGAISEQALYESDKRIDNFTAGLNNYTPHQLSSETLKSHAALAEKLNALVPTKPTAVPSGITTPKF